jgi:carboxypeptidase C (cathepsin A)
MIHYKRLLTALAVLALSGATLVSAPTARADASTENGVTVTQRTVTLRDGRRLPYTARAGYIPLVNDGTGETTAHIYFVSYSVAPSKDAPPRPLTFVFPGGPGAPATLDRLGPRHVQVKDGKATIVDNADTLLAATDLVFIDPVGTGYSRMTKPEYKSLFYNIKGDRDSLVEVMRIYLQRYDLHESPIFLSGGSYGSIRSVLVADAAMNLGINIRGIMVSAEGMSLSVLGTEIAYANLIPGFTVVAHAHGKLPADLQADRAKAIEEAKAWAADVYLPALMKGNRLTDEQRRAVAVQMARYSGLKPEVIESYNLKVGAEAFTNELLRDEGKSVGFYDTRIAGPAQSGPYDPRNDASLMARAVIYPSLAQRHLLRRELGMVSDTFYAGPFGGGWPFKEGFEDWMGVKWGFSMSQEPVGEGIEIVLPTFVRIVDRGVRAFIGMGIYDWACPPFGVDYVASRVPSSQKDRVRVIHYESGHSVPDAEFGADATAFIADVLKQPAPETARSMVLE